MAYFVQQHNQKRKKLRYK
uniref:Uncharacterized protein n=1 Tax=Rhizophora mucronata TaxID=61149 RepID=A0A2P2PVP8_RHIMU